MIILLKRCPTEVNFLLRRGDAHRPRVTRDKPCACYKCSQPRPTLPSGRSRSPERLNAMPLCAPESAYATIEYIDKDRIGATLLLTREDELTHPFDDPDLQGRIK